jgi:beta-carotene 3-hydroxylase
MAIYILNFMIIIATFLIMEGVAWATHKFVMHGFLWNLHHDHHQREDENWFEKNDAFFLIFGIPGALTTIIGSMQQFNFLFWIGLGISLYGLAYFLVHDIFIHQRFKIFRNSDSVYLRAIRRAHKMHHKHLGKHDGECFGMLWVPWHYFQTEINNKNKQ